MGILVSSAILIATLGPCNCPAVNGFDRLAEHDELAASEVLDNPADGVRAGRSPLGESDNTRPTS